MVQVRTLFNREFRIADIKIRHLFKNSTESESLMVVGQSTKDALHGDLEV